MNLSKRSNDGALRKTSLIGDSTYMPDSLPEYSSAAIASWFVSVSVQFPTPLRGPEIGKIDKRPDDPSKLCELGIRKCNVSVIFLVSSYYC